MGTTALKQQAIKVLKQEGQGTIELLDLKLLLLQYSEFKLGQRIEKAEKAIEHILQVLTGRINTNKFAVMSLLGDTFVNIKTDLNITTLQNKEGQLIKYL